MNRETANRIINLPTEVKEKVLRRLAALKVFKRELGQENIKQRLNALEESSQTTEKEVPKSSLTPYHYERNIAAQKSIDEMAKNPFTIEQAKEQAARLNNQSYKERYPDTSPPLFDLDSL